jgi:hypothetical protein
MKGGYFVPDVVAPSVPSVPDVVAQKVPDIVAQSVPDVVAQSVDSGIMNIDIVTQQVGGFQPVSCCHPWSECVFVR